MNISNDDLIVLHDLVQRTARGVGAEFFRALVKHLADVMHVEYAFAAEFIGNKRARMLAFWERDHLGDNIEWDLAGTPCEDVVKGQLCHHPSGLANKFPTDQYMVDVGMESYLGVPLFDVTGNVLGHLAICDTRPMPTTPQREPIFRIFAERATAELERMRAEKLLAESEQRLRDMYDEAPIAYVCEDLESRFISANRAAMRILGITPEDVPHTVGMSFIPDTPDAQRRVKEAFESIGRGTDTAGVVLELRRKDNGKPIWIQWWSKPDPSGKYTRTMFVDITERVLMEQEKARLQQQNLYLQEEIKSVHNFEEIVGQSAPMLNVFENVGQVARTDASVLICGETGTGKELIARAIHSNSSRKDKPLIKINCAALPTGLVESELFGHERGAFSGAITKRIGRFELANGGTIFLDEIGEIPLEVQAKLLRVLQEREFERVGSSTPIKVDVRIIAATNRDLRKAVAERTFREDLFYRLNVFPVTLPPLRERKGDVPLLVQFFVDKFSKRLGKRIQSISPQTMRHLSDYAWPGNIRELENVLERGVILASGTTLEIGPELLGGVVPGSSGAPVTLVEPPVPSSDRTLESTERSHILKVLNDTRWVIEGPAGAARILNLHPNTLRSRLKKLGIKRVTHEIS